jgi:hypothetical protein
VNGHAGDTQGAVSGARSASLFAPPSLDNYMTEDQQELFLEAMRKVFEHGFGSITIEIHAGKVCYLNVANRYQVK